MIMRESDGWKNDQDIAQAKGELDWQKNMKEMARVEGLTANGWKTTLPRIPGEIALADFQAAFKAQSLKKLPHTRQECITQYGKYLEEMTAWPNG